MKSNSSLLIGIIRVMGVHSALVACSGGSHGAGPGSDAGMPDANTSTDTGPSEEAGASENTSMQPDSGPPSDGSSAGDTGSSSDSGSPGCGSDAVDAGGKAYSGIILLTRTAAVPSASFSALARFQSLRGAFGPSCTGTTMGSCCYEAEPPVPTYVSAGTLSVSDGATVLATMTPPPTLALYDESSLFAPALTWAPGDTLTVAGNGGTVDAFTLSVVAPALLAVTRPAFAATMDVPLSADYVASWTPSGETCSEVEFGLAQTGPASLPYITCVVNDAQGTLTVPSTLLNKFTATTGAAFIERSETMETLAANAAVGVVAGDVITMDTTYTP